MRSLAVHLLFFLSGISGLVYQVVWVRLFGNVFAPLIDWCVLYFNIRRRIARSET